MWICFVVFEIVVFEGCISMIFLGCLFDHNKINQYRNYSRVGLQNAANAFQWSVVNGLEENRENVNIYNILPVGIYPQQYKKLIIRSRDWNHNNQSDDYEAGCINLPLIKQLMRGIKLKKQLKRNSVDKVLVYSTDLSLLFAVHGLRKNIPVALIVTDLPEYYDLQNKKAKLRTLYSKLVYKYLDRVDCFVLLTKAMEDRLPLKGRKSIVVEGIVDSLTCDSTYSASPTSDYSNDKITLLYTGTLNYAFGIDGLINAVKLLEGNYELIICGSGEMQNEIEILAKKDSRFVFKGQLPRNEVLSLQHKANLLVNPRTPDGEYTKYSFPSKTMEYMLSGTPVLMFKLPGIPKEYDDYLTYFKSEVPTTMATDIRIASSDKANIDKAKRAREYVLLNKNAKIQTRRIIEMMEINK